MKPVDVVKYYKTKTRAAAEIGVSEQSIRNWVNAGEMPRVFQLAVQTLTKNKLKADDLPS